MFGLQGYKSFKGLKDKEFSWEASGGLEGGGGTVGQNQGAWYLD